MASFCAHPNEDLVYCIREENTIICYRICPSLKVDNKTSEEPKVHGEPDEPPKVSLPLFSVKSLEDRPAESSKLEDKPAEEPKASGKPAEAPAVDDKPAEAQQVEDQSAEEPKVNGKPAEVLTGAFEPIARWDLLFEISTLLHHPSEDTLYVACGKGLLALHSKTGEIFAEQINAHEEAWGRKPINALAFDAIAGVLASTANSILKAWAVSHGGFKQLAEEHVGIFIDLCAKNEDDLWGLVFHLERTVMSMQTEELAKFVQDWLAFDAGCRSVSGKGLLMRRLPEQEALQQRGIDELQKIAKELFVEFHAQADSWEPPEKTTKLARCLSKAWHILKDLTVNCNAFNELTSKRRYRSHVEWLTSDKCSACIISLCDTRIMSWSVSESGFVLLAHREPATASERWRLLAGNSTGGPFVCVAHDSSQACESQLVAWSLNSTGFDCISRQPLFKYSIEYLAFARDGNLYVATSSTNEQALQVWNIGLCSICRSEGIKQRCPAKVVAKSCSICSEMLRKEQLLLETAFDGTDSDVERLIGEGVSIHARDGRGNTVLSEAAAGGSAATVTFLLEHHADVNATGEFGRSPLWRAANSGMTEVVRVLLGARANPGALDMNAEAPAANAEVQALLDDAPASQEIGVEPPGPTLFRRIASSSSPLAHGKLQELVFHPANCMLSRSSERVLQAWHTHKAMLQVTAVQPLANAGAVHAMVLDPINDYIISGGGGENSLKAWKLDADGLQLIAERASGHNVIMCLVCDPSSGLIFSGGFDSKPAMIRAWQLVDRAFHLMKEVPVSNGDQGCTGSLAFHPGTGMVISVGNYSGEKQIDTYRSIRAWRVTCVGSHCSIQCMAEHRSSKHHAFHVLTVDPSTGLTIAGGAGSASEPLLEAWSISTSLPGKLGRLPHHVQLLISSMVRGPRLLVTNATFETANGIYHQTEETAYEDWKSVTTYEDGKAYKLVFNLAQRKWQMWVDWKAVSIHELLLQLKHLRQRIKLKDPKQVETFIRRLRLQQYAGAVSHANMEEVIDKATQQLISCILNRDDDEKSQRWMVRFYLQCQAVECNLQGDDNPELPFYHWFLTPWKSEPAEGPWWHPIYISGESVGAFPPGDGWQCLAEDGSVMEIDPVSALTIKDASITGSCEVVATASRLEMPASGSCRCTALTAVPTRGLIISADVDGDVALLRAWTLSGASMKVVAQHPCRVVCALAFESRGGCIVGLTGGEDAIQAWKLSADNQFLEVPFPSSFTHMSRGGVPSGLEVLHTGHIIGASHSGSFIAFECTSSSGFKKVDFLQQWPPFAPTTAKTQATAEESKAAAERDPAETTKAKAANDD